VTTGATQRSNDEQRATIEWASFRLADGVTDSDLLSASDALHAEFLSRQPGFVRRELLRGENGLLADLVYWTDPESAGAAMQRAPKNPACLRYFQLMSPADPATPGGVLHFHRLKNYEMKA
jgi:hypothetical protein